MRDIDEKSNLPLTMSGKEKESSALPEKQSGGHFANCGAHGTETKGARAKKIANSNVNSRTNFRENSIERSNKEPTSSEDKWECDTCKRTFVNKDDQLLCCEYCGNYRCIQCLGINKTIYRGISGMPDLPWLCNNCVIKPLESLRQTKTIEDKRKEFISEFQHQGEERMNKVEVKDKTMRSDISSVKGGLVQEVKDIIERQCVWQWRLGYYKC